MNDWNISLKTSKGSFFDFPLVLMHGIFSKNRWACAMATRVFFQCFDGVFHQDSSELPCLFGNEVGIGEAAEKLDPGGYNHNVTPLKMNMEPQKWRFGSEDFSFSHPVIFRWTGRSISRGVPFCTFFCWKKTPPLEGGNHLINNLATLSHLSLPFGSTCNLAWVGWGLRRFLKNQEGRTWIRWLGSTLLIGSHEASAMDGRGPKNNPIRKGDVCPSEVGAEGSSQDGLLSG